MTNTNTKYDFAAIRRMNLRTLVEQSGVKLRGTANELYGPCPRCSRGDERSDRFHVKLCRDGNWRWFCRHCYYEIDGHIWHDTVDFITWRDGMGISEAVSYLGAPGLKTWATEKPAPVAVKPPPSENEVKRWNACLKESDVALAFLIDKNVYPDLIDKYQLGYRADYYGGAAITLPVRDLSGKIQNVQHRLLEPQPGQPKYLNLPNLGAWPFNMQAIPEAKKTGRLMIVEGAIKAMVSQQALKVVGEVMPTLGIVGKQTFMPMIGVEDVGAHKSAWYKQFDGIKEIWICLDPDADPTRMAWVHGLAASVSGRVRCLIPPIKVDDMLMMDSGIKGFFGLFRMAETVSRKIERSD